MMTLAAELAIHGAADEADGADEAACWVKTGAEAGEKEGEGAPKVGVPCKVGTLLICGVPWMLGTEVEAPPSMGKGGGGGRIPRRRCSSSSSCICLQWLQKRAFSGSWDPQDGHCFMENLHY